MKKISKFYTTVLSALYTMFFFNGFYYLIVGNMLAYIPMDWWPKINILSEAIVKGFIIGLTGRFLFEKTGIRGFLPYGVIGSVIGLHLMGVLFALATPFGTFYIKGPKFVFVLTFYFTMMVIIGSIGPTAIRRIINAFHTKEVIPEE